MVLATEFAQIGAFYQGYRSSLTGNRPIGGADGAARFPRGGWRNATSWRRRCSCNVVDSLAWVCVPARWRGGRGAGGVVVLPRPCGCVELRSPWWIAVAVAFVLLALILSAFAGGALRWMLVGCAVSSLLVLVVGWVVMVTEDRYDDVLAEVLGAYTAPDSGRGGIDVEFLPANLHVAQLASGSNGRDPAEGFLNSLCTHSPGVGRRIRHRAQVAVAHGVAVRTTRRRDRCQSRRT